MSGASRSARARARCVRRQRRFQRWGAVELQARNRSVNTCWEAELLEVKRQRSWAAEKEKLEEASEPFLFS